MSKKYILHHRQYEALQLIKEHPVAAYMGGIRSGKSITGAHFIHECIWERPNELGAIFSPTAPQLSKMTLVELKNVLSYYGIEQDKDYIVNKKPDKRFGYKTRFPADHKGVWSFWNGAQIYTFSLKSFYRGAEFGYSWGDEIQDATKANLDVVTGRMSGSSNPKTFYSFTPPRNNPDVDELAYGDSEGMGRLPIAVGTTYDNAANLEAPYLKTLENTYDKKTFAREVMCERVNLAGFPWLYSFDRNIHVSPLAVYQPSSTVYISFDFNVNPFVCTLAHRGYNEKTGKKYIHYFDIIVLTPEMCGGLEYIEAIIKEIKARTFTQSQRNAYMITGDVSGRKEDIVSKVGVVAWSKILDGFKIAKQNIILPRVNPTHVDSRVLCNSIISNYGEVLINPKCKELIRDCEYALAHADGHRKKDNRKDVTQQLDCLEAMVYDMNAFNGDFVRVR
jgi:hypothetical protein